MSSKLEYNTKFVGRKSFRSLSVLCYSYPNSKTLLILPAKSKYIPHINKSHENLAVFLKIERDAILKYARGLYCDGARMQNL